MSSIKDSATLAVIETLRVTSGYALNDEVFREFNRFLGLDALGLKNCVVLSQPHSATAKKGGRWSKRPLIGGETLQITGVCVYMGVRDGIIVQCALDDAGETLEFPAKVAEEVLEGYDEVLREFMTWFVEERDGADTTAEPTASDLVANEGARLAEIALNEERMKDMRFGSW